MPFEFWYIRTLSLTLPLLLSGLCLILTIKLKLFESLNKPIDNNISFNNKRLFGNNKTIRGVIVHILTAIVISVMLYLGYKNNLSLYIHPLFANSPIVIGLIYALFYTSGELINSFIKRQIGISSGGFSNSKYNYLQKFFDLSDGIITVAVVLYLFNFIAFYEAIVAGLIGISFHFLTDMFMERLKLKQKS